MHFTLWMCILLNSNILSAGLNVKRKSWPILKNFDIWNTASGAKTFENNNIDQFKNDEIIKQKSTQIRKGKVFHLFPVPVDGECLSNDGRRTGICLNVYECRLKGGIAHGECSMGFGVCCIFLATCDQTIRNNITYLVSPNFPSSMPQNLTFCKYKLRTMDSNVSQLRIDFIHFSLGQPNRKTGLCDGDVFNVTGGPSGSFLLCGQNSGQHVYYDVEARKISHSRKKNKQSLVKSNTTMLNTTVLEEQMIEITMNFSNRFSPIRFWEVRIAQIPFSQRAPANCLQYYTGNEGVVQTFNFADNGRHLANQDYKACIRQEEKMCSIIYQPCDDQSFKIGPTKLVTQQHHSIMMGEAAESAQGSFINNSSTFSEDQVSTMSSITSSIPAETTNATMALSDSEGSGEENIQTSGTATSEKPVRGGFDILSLFRSAFSFRNLARSNRQFFTTCNDRITMPCIIEDFVGVGMGPLPGCEPVHCGNQCALWKRSW
ncbi:uncharacterized protein LOC129914208 isoform X2 [Episyrphus balteatus]|uniref:uncharacterized protein LOC129914208 isoform X2 n=1 Tax=Episyrphus balteatus TaxID=286459 RepID=UPI00248545DC|nr:uncharacterized protein LOC129914208 isoform X2 [Episyrphus balteatus]